MVEWIFSPVLRKFPGVKINVEGESPRIINLADDLISAFAFRENVWLIDAARCF